MGVGMDLIIAVIVVPLIGALCLWMYKRYSNSIREYFLRQAIYTATKLAVMVHNSGDENYSGAWTVILQCLEEQSNKSKPLLLDDIFNDLFESLQKKHLGTNDLKVKEVIERAITIANMWHNTTASEMRRIDSLAELRLDVRRFISIIKSVIP